MTRAKKIQEILKAKKTTVLPIFGDIIPGARIESTDPNQPVFYLYDDDTESKRQ